VGLPVSDEIEGVDEIEDVEGEVVANGEREGEFDEEDERDGGPGGESGGEEKPEGGEEDVEAGIEDAVAVVAGGEGGAAVALDDHRGVFQYFPGTFGQHGEEKTQRQGDSAAGGQAQDRVEGQAVDDMGERVGVGDLLGKFGGIDGGPEGDAVGLGDGEAVHGELDGGGEGEEKEGGEEEGVRKARGRSERHGEQSYARGWRITNDERRRGAFDESGP
jgi:hypothetical protein